MLAFVKQNELKKEQIVSISTNESEVETGKAVLILVYREDKDSSMTSLENL